MSKRQNIQMYWNLNATKQKRSQRVAKNPMELCLRFLSSSIKEWMCVCVCVILVKSIKISKTITKFYSLIVKFNLFWMLCTSKWNETQRKTSFRVIVIKSNSKCSTKRNGHIKHGNMWMCVWGSEHNGTEEIIEYIGKWQLNRFECGACILRSNLNESRNLNIVWYERWYWFDELWAFSMQRYIQTHTPTKTQSNQFDCTQFCFNSDALFPFHKMALICHRLNFSMFPYEKHIFHWATIRLKAIHFEQMRGGERERRGEKLFNQNSKYVNDKKGLYSKCHISLSYCQVGAMQNSYNSIENQKSWNEITE